MKKAESRLAHKLVSEGCRCISLLASGMFVADHQFQLMKRSVLIMVAIALVLASCAVAILWALGHPKISMKVVEYRKWPHGAIIRLTNRTGVRVQYFAELNG